MVKSNGESLWHNYCCQLFFISSIATIFLRVKGCGLQRKVSLVWSTILASSSNFERLSSFVAGCCTYKCIRYTPSAYTLEDDASQTFCTLAFRNFFGMSMTYETSKNGFCFSSNLSKWGMFITKTWYIKPEKINPFWAQFLFSSY